MLFPAILPPLLIGLLLCSLLTTSLKKNPVFRISLIIFLGPGIGVAVVSGLYFIWCSIFGAGQFLPAYWLLEFSLILVFLLLHFCPFYRNSRVEQQPQINEKRSNRFSLLGWITLLVFLAFLGTFVADWYSATRQSPNGDWDAWAIWNMRARFLSSGEAWKAGFTNEIEWSHPDYPLLLPGFTARTWALAGQSTQVVPALTGLLFLLLTIGLVIVAIHHMVGFEAAWFAGIFTLVVCYQSLSYKQFADQPLAYFILAANLLIFLAETSPGKNTGIWALAGLFTAACLWTKNDGAAFLIAIVLVEAMQTIWRKVSLKKAAERGLAFTLGFLPIFLVLLYFKATLAPQSDLLQNFSWAEVIRKISTPQRYGLIFQGFATYFAIYGAFKIRLLPSLILYLYMSGLSITEERKQSMISLGFRILLIMLVYSAIYLLTPWDLTWHISTSILRLISHFLPSLILLCFVGTRNLQTSG